MLKYKKGFTVTEMLIIIAIIIIITAIALPEFRNIRDRQMINSISIDIVSAIRKAHSQTQASLDSSSYGVFLGDGDKDKIVIFKGEMYNESSSDNEIIELNYGVEIKSFSFGDNKNEFYFERLTGFPNIIGFFTISLNSYDKSIIIDKTGRVSLE